MTATTTINRTDTDWNQTTTVVLAALRAGAVSHITEAAIAAQCNVKLRNVSMLLADACEDGPLVRTRDAAGELGYSLRSIPLQVAPAPTPATPAAPPSRPASREPDRNVSPPPVAGTAGLAVPAAIKPAPRPATAATPKRGNTGKRLPKMDAATIPIEYDVACPPNTHKRGGSWWNALFARLDRVGAASGVIDMAYRGSCAKGKDIWRKHHPQQRLELRSVGADGFRVHRTA